MGVPKVFCHNDLVEIAAKYLRRYCVVVATEVVCGRETADAIGWQMNGVSTIIECKVTRSDFKLDAKKFFRNHLPDLGMGMFRYYLAPKGLLKREEMPEGWRLLEVDSRGFVMHCMNKPVEKCNCKAEITCLLSVLRRLPAKIDGVSIRHYTYYQSKTKAAIWIGNEQ